jgi:hypothetical protein
LDQIVKEKRKKRKSEVNVRQGYQVPFLGKQENVAFYKEVLRLELAGLMWRIFMEILHELFLPS